MDIESMGAEQISSRAQIPSHGSHPMGSIKRIPSHGLSSRRAHCVPMTGMSPSGLGRVVPSYFFGSLRQLKKVAVARAFMRRVVRPCGGPAPVDSDVSTVGAICLLISALAPAPTVASARRVKSPLPMSGRVTI